LLGRNPLPAWAGNPQKFNSHSIAGLEQKWTKS
jgi:hypothetical protein